jgi:5-(carboxyamino)imidazole ribonucleotide synthase
MFDVQRKIGILGGGQLGKMLCQAASPWDWQVEVLDPTPAAPAAPVAYRQVVGDFRVEADVLRFGADKDLLTIEIEHVHTGALRQLKAMGKTVHPNPDVLDIIKDKGTQKQFYRQHRIPTADFECFEGPEAVAEAIRSGKWSLPVVQKTREAGYDGRGVSVLRTPDDVAHKLLEGPSLLEQAVDIRAELSVVVARGTSGESIAYDATEMVFHPQANLLDMLVCPARVPAIVSACAQALALEVAEAYGLCGLLAVELFWTRSGDLLVNEVAPRPHNSGHHTIESAVTSQYQQHWRAISGLPLGDTRLIRPAAMLNLLGAAGQSGPVVYMGVEQALGMSGVYLHLYGKKETRPYRKMGHITATADSLEEAMALAARVREMVVPGALKA